MRHNYLMRTGERNAVRYLRMLYIGNIGLVGKDPINSGKDK